MTEGGGRGTLHSAEQLLEEESNYVKMQRIGSFLLTFLAFTATARATNWFILNGATERCVSAEAFAAKKGGARPSPLCRLLRFETLFVANQVGRVSKLSLLKGPWGDPLQSDSEKPGSTISHLWQVAKPFGGSPLVAAI